MELTCSTCIILYWSNL